MTSLLEINFSFYLVKTMDKIIVIQSLNEIYPSLLH
jgi:hypothetical protein